MVHFTGQPQVDVNVKFFALINNNVDLVSGLLGDCLVHIFNHPTVAKYIPAKVSYSHCKFYRLRRPVPLGEDNTDDEDDKEDGTPDDVIQACLDESNRVLVKPTKTKVHRLATGKQISDDHIYLVIDFPDREYHHRFSGSEYLMLLTSSVSQHFSRQRRH